MCKARYFFAAFLTIAALHSASAQINNPGTPTSGSPANNDCAKYVVSGGNVQSITTAGGPCGSAFTPSAATQLNDTNVTLTLTGTPATALLQAVQFQMGWQGTLAAARLNSNVVQGVTNDTNVTGSIAAQNLTLGWTGVLAAARLNSNVVQAVTNDTNITGSIAAQNLTLGWTGVLAAARLNSNVVQAVTNDTNITGSIAAQNLTLAWAGQLAISRGGTGAGTQSGAANNIFPTPTRAGDIVYWNGTQWTTLAGNNVGTQVLSESALGAPAWSAAGAGTVTSVTCGTGLSGGTFTASGTCALALTNTVLDGSPTSGTTISTAGQMWGFGGTCHLTPTYSSRVQVTFDGNVANTVTASANANLQLRFGTGTAPVNGGATAGSNVGSSPAISTNAIGNFNFVSMTRIVTGLTPGTAYWFDISPSAISGGTLQFNSPNCSISEIGG